MQTTLARHFGLRIHCPSGTEHFSKRHLTILVLSCALVAREGGGCQNGAVVLVEKDPPNEPAVAIPRPSASPVDVDANLLCSECRKDGDDDDDDDDDDDGFFLLLISCVLSLSVFMDIIIVVELVVVGFADDESYMFILASSFATRLKDVVIWGEVKE